MNRDGNMIVPNGATVAVADGKKLRLFRNKGHEPCIELVALPDPELEVRNHGSGTRHHSSAANPDTARLSEDNFAASAVDYLSRQALSGGVECLIVIADPRTLGEMRPHFHDVLSSKMIAELAKDLADRSLKDIEDALERA